MVHETGHMLGILHCVNFHCLMNGSNGHGDTCGSTSFLCPVCLRKLIFALSSLVPPSLGAIDNRYAALDASLQALASTITDADACSAPALLKDAEWLAQRRAQLRAASLVATASANTPDPPHLPQPRPLAAKPALQALLPSRHPVALAQASAPAAVRTATRFPSLVRRPLPLEGRPAQGGIVA
ncbi:unnamed protein product [Polarella glacialis]|uniref:Uncharacterized protein n=1 Tax=Polarella glacialis TaxID=89957 RepID=A0A813H332_POLGL|nr:unnamed protein product [Polarella glacialis]